MTLSGLFYYIPQKKYFIPSHNLAFDAAQDDVGWVEVMNKNTLKRARDGEKGERAILAQCTTEQGPPCKITKLDGDHHGDPTWSLDGDDDNTEWKLTLVSSDGKSCLMDKKHASVSEFIRNSLCQR
jgi:hypothetical protein